MCAMHACSVDISDNMILHIFEIVFHFQLCDTYPSLLYIPASVSTHVLIGSSKFRSRGRLPALSYLHRGNQVGLASLSITNVQSTICLYICKLVIVFIGDIFGSCFHDLLFLSLTYPVVI